MMMEFGRFGAGCAPAPLGGLRGARVLLVDADTRALLVHFALLEALGADVTPADSAATALHLVRDAAPLDAVMVAARLRALPGHRLVDALRRRRPGLAALLIGAGAPGWPRAGAAPTAFLPAAPPIGAVADMLGALCTVSAANRGECGR
jgi:CheY-like chemotaxis protein